MVLIQSIWDLRASSLLLHPFPPITHINHNFGHYSDIYHGSSLPLNSRFFPVSTSIHTPYDQTIFTSKPTTAFSLLRNRVRGATNKTTLPVATEKPNRAQTANSRPQTPRFTYYYSRPPSPRYSSPILSLTLTSIDLSPSLPPHHPTNNDRLHTVPPTHLTFPAFLFTRPWYPTRELR